MMTTKSVCCASWTPCRRCRTSGEDSIEEKILELHRSKRDLASDLLEGGEMSARLTDEDLLNLIRG